MYSIFFVGTYLCENLYFKLEMAYKLSCNLMVGLFLENIEVWWLYYTILHFLHSEHFIKNSNLYLHGSNFD